MHSPRRSRRSFASSRDVRSGAYCALMQRLRMLSEAECYARCYGWRGSEAAVKVSRIESRRARYEPTVAGETLRALLEQKLDAREPEAA